MKKYLVELLCFYNNSTTPIVVCDTKEKAEEWISREMEDKKYNGTGVFQITEVKHYD